MATRSMERALWVGFVSLIFAACLVVGYLIASSIAQADASEPEYKKNSDGLTYGTVIEASPWGEMPDLVAVMATNGEVGYVYWSVIENTPPPPANPEEAERYMNDKIARDSVLLVEFLAEDLDVEVNTGAVNALLAYESAEAYMVGQRTAPGVMWTVDEEARISLAESLNIDAADLPEGIELRGLLTRVFSRVQNENFVEIPV